MRERWTPTQGEGEQGLGDEVAVAHRVEGVLEPAGEAEVGRDAVGVERERGAGQRAGTQRRHVARGAGRRAVGRRLGPAPSRGRAGGGRAAPAGPAAGGCSRGGRRRPPPRPGRAAPAGGRGRARPPRGATASRTGGGRWPPGRSGSGRCGASPRRRPASSVTRRSTAVWMSSSAGPNAKAPVAELLADLVEGGEHRVPLRVGQDAGASEATHVRRASRRGRRATGAGRTAGSP